MSSATLRARVLTSLPSTAVRYDVAQTLSADQQALARTNIGLDGNFSLGSATADAIDVSGNATVGGDLAVSGAIGVGGNPSHSLDILAAGTATVAPLRLAAGTNLTAAVTGAGEYDGKALYFTPVDSNRGVVFTAHFLSLSADQTGTNGNSAQTWFPGGGSTTITLPASTSYFFDGKLSLSRSAGTTSHTIGLLFGGAATITSINYTVHVTDQNATSSSLSSAQVIEGASASSLVITAASANASQFNTIEIKGIVRINGAGTFIPQFIYSAAPGGAPTIKANSWFRMLPIGSNTVLNVGNWS